VELELGVPADGSRLLLELDARAELDFAEVTFADHSSQVIDLGRVVRPAGLYTLTDLPAGRSVEHVRLVGRATDPVAKVSLSLLR
jgi:hypothetical protein